MASENNTTDNTKVKYKFGTSELPLDLYIKNLKDNYQSYIDSRNWSDGQKAEFKGAFDNYIQGFQDQLDNGTSRFSTDYTGTVFDNDGLITEKDSDDYYYDSKGNQYTSEQYNGFKPKQQKNYYAFNANRQAASYLNIIGKALRDKLNSTTSSTSTGSTKFDYNTNGFARWYKIKYQPLNEQLDFNTDKELDKNKDGSYGTAKRAASLSTAIGEYINSLSNDLDYSELGGKDNYIANLNAAIDSLKDGYSTEDITALRQLIGDNFIKAYFDTSTGTESTANESDYDRELKEIETKLASINEQKTLEEKRAQLERAEREQQLNQYIRTHSFTDAIKYNNLVRPSDLKEYLNGLDIDSEASNAAQQFLQKVSMETLGSTLRTNGLAENGNWNQDILKKLYAAALYNALEAYDSNGGNYTIPGTENYDNLSVYVFNPSEGTITIKSMLENESLKQKIYENWDKAQNALSSNSSQTLSNKQGGTLKFQDGGTTSWEDFKRDYKNKEAKRRVKKQEHDATVQEYQKEDRGFLTQTYDKETAEAKAADAVWTPANVARVTSAVADIASIVASYAPVYGTAISAATGLGSTAINFFTDWADDSQSATDMWKNLAANLGMDVVGLIPGMGATKVGKVAKALKSISAGLITALSAANATDSIASLNKLLSGKDMTQQDWVNLGNGLKIVTGLGRKTGTARRVNVNRHETKRYTITGKDNKKYTVGEEDWGRIRNAKTLEDQNKILRDATKMENADMGNFYTDSRFRHPMQYNRRPEVTESTFANINRPGKGNGWADENSLFRGLDTRSSGKLPPLTIARPSVTAAKPASSKKSKGKPVSDAKKAEYRQTYSELKNDPYYGGVDPDEFKQGGSLNVSKVRKMVNGDSIPQQPTTDGTTILTEAGNSWFNNLWSQKALTDWTPELDKSKVNDTDLNNNSHYHAGDLSEAWETNKAYTNSYDAIKKDLQNYFSKSSGSSNDIISAYNKDASSIRSFFDSGNLRYGTTDDVIKAHNQLHKKLFASRNEYIEGGPKYQLGYSDKLENILGSTTWLRRMDRYEKEFDKLTDEEKKSRVFEITLNDGSTIKVYKKANGDIALLSNDKPSGETSPAAQDPIDTSKRTGVRTEGSGNGNNDKLTKGKGKILINPTYIYGLPRAIMSDRDNRRMTDLAKSIIKPVLTDPIESYKYTRSDLNEEINGEQAKAAIVNAASQPLTSDASYEAARRLAAEVKGDEYKLQGLQKSDQVRDTYDEQNWQLQQQNAQNRHDVAMANRKGMAAAQYNKGTQELAYMSKKNNIWDTYGQQLEYEAKSKYQKAKAAQEKMSLSAIQKDVYYNPANHGILLTPEQQEIWEEALRTGTVPSDNAKYQQYLAVYNKLQEKINELAASHYGFTYTPVNQEILNDTSWGPKIITERLGGKLAKGGRTSADYIAVAGIQARTSDANRFQRQIKATIDRNEKVIDRLARSMYDLIKLAK